MALKKDNLIIKIKSAFLKKRNQTVECDVNLEILSDEDNAVTLIGVRNLTCYDKDISLDEISKQDNNIYKAIYLDMKKKHYKNWDDC